jgi:hypothetical protein
MDWADNDLYFLASMLTVGMVLAIGCYFAKPWQS